MDISLVVFDLDGTLAESKQPIDAEMAGLLRRLLLERKVAVIGGGKYELFQKFLIAKIGRNQEQVKNLFLFPTTATSFYRHEKGKWRNVYEHKLSQKERKEVFGAFKQAFKDLKYVRPKKIYGKIIEDRDSQITFSALGQKAPLALKKKWVAQNAAFKMQLAKRVQKYLPKLEVRAAGYTSIDVTKKGIDKAYGIRQIEKYLKIPEEEMIFIGDALFKGGNDYAVKTTGVKTIAVKGPKETKKIIRRILASSSM